MTRSEWRHFDGLCSHSNVPDNAHWDIGDGRLDLVAAAARRALHLPTPRPHQEDDDMIGAAIDAALEEAGWQPSPKRGQARAKWIDEARRKQAGGGDPWDAVRTLRHQLGLSVEPTWPS